MRGDWCASALPDLGRNSEVVSEVYLAHRLDEPLGPVAHALHRALMDIWHSR